MGRPKVKIIDDSQPEAEIKDQKSKIKNSDSKSVILGTTLSEQSESKGRTPESNKEDSGLAALARMTKEKKPQKPGKTKKVRSKKYQEAVKDLDKNKTYALNEAMELVKKLSFSKFEGTLEAHINTSGTGIRGLVSLPFATGRKLKILAFGNNAEESGADITGSDEVIESINKGKVDFDLVVTTPQWMPKLAKIARILGPRGLMPNPKNGTITDDLKKAVSGFQAGKTEYKQSLKTPAKYAVVYKTEAKAPVIHLAIGKISQPTEELSANIKALLQILGKTRVKKVTLSPTMGPGVKIDLSSI